MLTIGQLARTAGVTTKAVRVYHAKGLLAEPPRDRSGYRRYGAQDVVDLARITTLVRAGVPLNEIAGILRAADQNSDDESSRRLQDVQDRLEQRIRDLRTQRDRIASLGDPDKLCLPAPAVTYMAAIETLGLDQRHVRAIRDGWILAYAMAPELAAAFLPSRAALLHDPDYVAMLHDLDGVMDADETDPRVDLVADACIEMADRMTMLSDLTDFENVAPEVITLLAGHQGVNSPAWRRIDAIVEHRLNRVHAAARPPRHDPDACATGEGRPSLAVRPRSAPRGVFPPS